MHFPDFTQLANKQINTLIGFDDVFNRLGNLAPHLERASFYPPYNIRRTSETEYVIELAVAGFAAEDLDISLDNGILTVTGAVQNDEVVDYIHKGIAERAFTRKFTLADTVFVKGADLVNGMLKINLERVVPEEKKAKKIAIGNAMLKAEAKSGESTAQFLAEKYGEK